jgi:hypothetical protein
VISLHLFSEFRLPDGTETGTLLRAHPNYCKEGEWRDYVLVDYVGEGHYPAKLLFFYRNPIEDEWMALVQHCLPVTATQKKQASLLFRHYTLSQSTGSVGEISTSTISDRCYVIEHGVSGANSTLLQPLPVTDSLDVIYVEERMQAWPREFVSSAYLSEENHHRSLYY